MRLKRDSPNDLVQAIRALEEQSDRCHDGLRLFSAGKGRASWAILVALVLRTESERAQYGYRDYDVKLINLSKVGALALRWIQENRDASPSAISDYSWNDSLGDAANETLSIALNYFVFLGCFPMSHRQRLLAELRSESTVRFAVPGGEAARRVSAFHKGFRPVIPPALDEGLVLKKEQRRERDVVVSQCFYAGHLRMAYPEPLGLYRLLLPSYLDRLCAMFRRSDAIDLGTYSLEELKRAYAALTTILSVHEDLCFRFGIAHEYPVNSCVMVRPTQEWSNLVATLAGLEEEKTLAMVGDLTMRDRFWDLHVQPFIPVGEGMLAVAPQFPLHSRPDENILRICGHIRREDFDEASRQKEQEMLDGLLPRIPKRFTPQTRVHLPQGEFDLLLVDEKSSTVLLAELKWLRKPFDWPERIHRDSGFEDGLKQLSDAKRFLNENPGFLFERGRLGRRLDEYEHVATLLIARDHFLWPDVDCIVVDYEVFKGRVSASPTLAVLVSEPAKYEWLPVENEHFVVRFDSATTNGVTVESEIFYRIS